MGFRTEEHKDCLINQCCNMGNTVPCCPRLINIIKEHSIYTPACSVRRPVHGCPNRNRLTATQTVASVRSRGRPMAASPFFFSSRLTKQVGRRRRRPSHAGGGPRASTPTTPLGFTFLVPHRCRASNLASLNSLLLSAILA